MDGQSTTIRRFDDGASDSAYWYQAVDIPSFAEKPASGRLRLPIAKIGRTFHGDYGWNDVTKRTIDEIVTEFGAQKAQNPGYSLNVNYFHSRKIPPKDRTPENQASAGAIHGLIFDASEGQLYGDFEPTPRASAAIAARELRGTSMEFSLGGWLDKYTGKKRDTAKLFGVALLNDPHLDLMPTIQAANNFGSSKSQHSEANMNELLRLLGAANESDGLLKLADLQRKASELEAQNASLQTKTPKEGQVVVAFSEFNSLKDTASKYRQELAKKNDADFERHFSAAVKAGKAKPAAKDDWKEMYFADAEHVEVRAGAVRQLSDFAGSSADSGNRDAAGQGDDGSDDSVKSFEDYIQAEMDGGLDEAKAEIAARKKHPQAYEAWLRN